MLNYQRVTILKNLVTGKDDIPYDIPYMKWKIRTIVIKCYFLMSHLNISYIIIIHYISFHISGWWLTYPFWKIWKSMGRMTSHIWNGQIKAMFQTTNQIRDWVLNRDWQICFWRIGRPHWISETSWSLVFDSWHINLQAHNDIAGLYPNHMKIFRTYQIIYRYILYPSCGCLNMIKPTCLALRLQTWVRCRRSQRYQLEVVAPVTGKQTWIFPMDPMDMNWIV